VLRALELCRGVPTPFAELAAALAEDFPDTWPPIANLIHTLLWEGLLVSELRPPLTGDPAGYLLSRLDRLVAARVERDHLAGAIAACEHWQRLDAAAGAEGFASLVRTPRAVAASLPEGTPVQVDMMGPLGGDRITRAVGEEAARAGRTAAPPLAAARGLGRPVWNDARRA
jgi:class I lanthipeptide synthase